MGDVVLWTLRLMLTRKFWFLVVASFFGVLAMWVRSSIRNDLYIMASEVVGKRYRV